MFFIIIQIFKNTNKTGKYTYDMYLFNLIYYGRIKDEEENLPAGQSKLFHIYSVLNFVKTQLNNQCQSIINV